MAVDVTPEAAVRIARVGMNQELKLMLDRVQANVLDLRALAVRAGCATTGRLANLVVIEACRAWDDANPPRDLVEWDFAGWCAQVFPPTVCRNVILQCRFATTPTP